MKNALFLLLFISTLFLSCIKKHDKNTEKTIGKINTISVIIDDQLWNGEVGDSIRNKFAAPVIGLPKEEPLFNINQYPVKLLEGFVTKTRNSVVIKKEAKNNFEIVENEYASPQNVFHISGKTTASILALIEKNAPEIIKKMRQTEIEENQRIIDTARIETKKIQKKFNINLHIPKGYNYVFERRKFIWLKKEITSGNTSILIYQLPFRTIKPNTNIINKIIRNRDSIGRLYIRGTIPRTHMITEDSYSPYLFHINLNGKEAYETKGTWELKNDYMSGPFINYTIIDRTNKRILVLEGFCYDPSKEKRDLMFELESIIKSVEFLKKK
ncbi:DUF4837 family protein [Flavobacterium luteum]|uniref:DUF4837 family protein n=1 Tax=Flavobacterium luteum TaxID=2026654 RepID=A0A7J5AHV8_9FLAO|nr:DUF4837 family protein [Flavobacterium luteum]KAB1157105.1 DUF4837 family protein [Flavobacterium luteum]